MVGLNAWKIGLPYRRRCYYACDQQSLSGRPLGECPVAVEALFSVERKS